MYYISFTNQVHVGVNIIHTWLIIYVAAMEEDSHDSDQQLIPNTQGVEDVTTSTGELVVIDCNDFIPH